MELSNAANQPVAAGVGTSSGSTASYRRHYIAVGVLALVAGGFVLRLPVRLGVYVVDLG